MTVEALDHPAYPARPHLTDSGRLQWNLRAKTPAAAAAIDGLLQELEASEARTRQRKQADRDSLRAAMEAMVFGLAEARGSAKPWRAYSRQKNDYSFFVEHAGVTWTAVTTVADFLAAHGLAEARRGSYSRPEGGGKGSGYQSRLNATTLLMDRVGGLEGNVTSAPVAHPIRVKGPKDVQGRKPLRRPEEWPGSAASVFGDGGPDAAAQSVLDGNRLRAACHISLEGEATDAGWDDADPEDRASVTDRHAVHLYRVFSNDSWRQGGRFYGGFWQGLSKADRSRLLIDGEETVELDFQACHVRMCYHLDGRPLPTDRDPYTIPGIDPELRGVVKGLTLRLLGAGVSTRVSRPEALKDWSKKDYARLVQQITDEHPPLSGWFRAGHWATLQNLDSQITDAVMSDLTAQGVPCLPVHDSFIVPLSAERALGLAMARAWRSVLKAESGVEACPVVTGWTSKETEAAYHSSLPPPPISVVYG